MIKKGDGRQKYYCTISDGVSYETVCFYLYQKETLKVTSYINDGYFKPTTILPKALSALWFIQSGDDKRAIVANVTKAKEAVNEKTGTIIK